MLVGQGRVPQVQIQGYAVAGLTVENAVDREDVARNAIREIDPPGIVQPLEPHECRAHRVRRLHKVDQAGVVEQINPIPEVAETSCREAASVVEHVVFGGEVDMAEDGVIRENIDDHAPAFVIQDRAASDIIGHAVIGP